MPGYLTADDLLDRLFLKTLVGQRLKVWSDISEVLLGEEEIDTDGDALNYISTDTVTTSIRESIKINGGHVLEANIIADNGILHIIDKVLIVKSFGAVEESTCWRPPGAFMANFTGA